MTAYLITKPARCHAGEEDEMELLLTGLVVVGAWAVLMEPGACELWWLFVGRRY